jgi:hypothetical protein
MLKANIVSRPYFRFKLFKLNLNFFITNFKNFSMRKGKRASSKKNDKEKLEIIYEKENLEEEKKSKPSDFSAADKSIDLMKKLSHYLGK